MYKPPFTVSAKSISMIAEISALVERFVIALENDKLKLRRINKIKTIQSSLAIEGNNLSEEQISDILDGKRVVAPLREIQEVKNAIATYDNFSNFDAFSPKDLLKAHKLMMQGLVDNAGEFRRGGVGVFKEDKAIHIAPPAERVPSLIDNLFDWLKGSQDHLLIRSCVFHFEFEFIYPFIDGNGRMGRLWQSLILAKLNPVFESLPVETMVHDNQQAYYNAINESALNADAGIFVEFMLNEILKTLKSSQSTSNTTPLGVVNGVVNPKVTELLNCIKTHEGLNATQLGKTLNIAPRTLSRYLQSLSDSVEYIGSPRKGGYFVKR
ncbi:MAG: Fic family protein [Opitutales bacterium]